MGLDCEETGVSTDGRFFSREPGMTKVWDRWNRDGKMGPLTAWAKDAQESPTRGLGEDYARSVGCHERNGPQILLQRRQISQYGSELTIRKRCYLRLVTACRVAPGGSQSDGGALGLGSHCSGGLQSPYELNRSN